MGSASTSPDSETSGKSQQRHIDTSSVRHSTLQGAPTSPRIAILSQTSLQRPAADPTSASTADSRSRDARALEKRRDVHKKSSSERRRRTTTHSDLVTSLSRLELDRLRNDPRASEELRMRDLLETAVRQVHIESKRAEDLQRVNDETAIKFRVLNENRLSAQQEAAKAKTELKLYQFQLDNAQKEIEKAKTALKEIEKQRDEAEEAAARAREKARKYQQERQVAVAKEEGRRLGYEAGLKHAKKEKEILTAGRPRRSIPQPPSRSSKGKERAHSPEEYDRYSRPRYYSHGRNDTLSSPDDSPSQTPKRDYRGSTQPSRPRQHMEPTSSTDPRRSGRGPNREEDEDDYESDDEESPPGVRPARTTTPSIQYWPVDIPAADRLNESFNSHENPNDAVRQGSRKKWVTAHEHREIRGSPLPPTQSDPVPTTTTTKSPIPVPQTPQLAPSLKNQPMPLLTSGPAPRVPPASGIMMPPGGFTPANQQAKPPPLIKSGKFWARRPSLAKTKQQATSWYRSFSIRKKNKPVIDPIAEEATLPPQAYGQTTPPVQTSVDSPEAVKLYGPRPQQSQTWYRSSAPPSIRNQDFAYARRQQSDGASVSTRVSQFDLLSTPAQQLASSISLPRAKNKGQVKEKDSFLSVIKEDSSRGHNTPERPGTGGTGYGQPSGFHHDSFSGSVQNRYSHRPPTIFVPDPDAVLPSGIANYQGYPSNPNLHRKSSIDIDVVPPSGMAPDVGTSPPHTGRNHLSPYHVFHPAESTRSLRNNDSFPEHPAWPDPAATSHRSAHSRTVSADAGPSGQHGQDSPLQQPQAPFMTWGNGSQSGRASRAGNIHPSSSNRHLRNASSTGTFKIVNPDPEPDSRSTRTRTPGRSQPVLADFIAPGNDQAMVVLTPRRETSRASMKSNKSYSRYNPDEYVDPAFWGVNGPGEPPAALPAQPRPGMIVDATDMERAASRLSRRTSVNSGLSYA